MRHGLAQIAALKRATGLLAAADIPCLVLKGLPLSQCLYGHPLARSARDIDLLVSSRTFQAAERVLVENGWSRVGLPLRTVEPVSRHLRRGRETRAPLIAYAPPKSVLALLLLLAAGMTEAFGLLVIIPACGRFRRAAL